MHYVPLILLRAEAIIPTSLPVALLFFSDGVPHTMGRAPLTALV
jgi:hypothetical protein